MKIKIKTLGMAMITLLFMSFSTPIFAQAQEKAIKKNNTSHKDNGAKCCMSIKDISEDQRVIIEKNKLANEKEIFQLQNQIAEKRSHLKILETTDVADMKSINSTIDEICTMQGDIMKKEAERQQEIRKILTEKQRLEFDLKDCKMGKKMPNKMNGNKPPVSCHNPNK